MIEFLIYLKTIILLLILSISGLIIVRRICSDTRIQLLLPTSVITGIALYIFLLNLTAHFIKGEMGFYVALLIEIIAAFLLRAKMNYSEASFGVSLRASSSVNHSSSAKLEGYSGSRIKAGKIIFPQKGEKAIWIITSLIWFIFLFYITATGSASSPDWLHNSYYASLLLRGDFPIHNPFQPGSLSSYHIGMPEILGLFRLFTGGADTFLGSTIALLTLFAMSQILQWTLKLKSSVFNLLLHIFIPLTFLMSLGNLMIIWPYQLRLPQIDNGIYGFLRSLPTLYNTYVPYGAPASLDGLNLFLHRMLSLSIFTALIPLVVYPNKLKKILSSGLIIILLGALALSDEAVFIVAAPSVVLISFFTLFEKNIKQWILFSLIALFVTIFQGGLVTEAVFKSDASFAKVLLFPADQTGPTAKFTNYHSYRMEAQESKSGQVGPLKWFHFGAVWQVGALLITCCAFTFYSFKRKLGDKSHLYLTWLFCSSAIFALIAFHAVVPIGWTHLNGNRFLSLAYQLSGVGIIILIIFFWINFKGKSWIKVLSAWIVLVSIIPTIAILFPREKINWFTRVIDPPKAEHIWIKDNLRVNTKILPFTAEFPTDSAVELVKMAGVFTPLWYEKPEVQGSGITPPYFDLFYTQNPEVLKKLKIEYILTNKTYRSTLNEERLADLNNQEYFKTEYIDKQRDVIITKILPAYFQKGENYNGTFYELSQILPEKGKFFIESAPEINETVWRIAFLTLQMKDYEMYYSTKFLPVYNYIINVDLKYHGESNDKYDYLVLGLKTDPKFVCSCQTELLWSDKAGYVNVWKVK